MKNRSFYFLIILVFSYLSCQETVPTGNYLGQEETVAIEYTLSDQASIGISIYNSVHNLVRVLMATTLQPAGTHVALWDKKDDRGVLVPDGIYYAKIDKDGQEWQVQTIGIASELKIQERELPEPVFSCGNATSY